MFCYEAAVDTEEEDNHPLSMPAPNYVSDDEDIHPVNEELIQNATGKTQATRDELTPTSQTQQQCQLL